jgi:hypothetical protein
MTASVRSTLPSSHRAGTAQDPDPAEIFDRDATHIWSGSADGPVGAADTAVLSPEELARVRMLPPGRASRYAATRVAVRHILGRYLDGHPGEILLGRSICPGCGSPDHQD